VRASNVRSHSVITACLCTGSCGETFHGEKVDCGCVERRFLFRLGRLVMRRAILPIAIACVAAMGFCAANVLAVGPSRGSVLPTVTVPTTTVATPVTTVTVSVPTPTTTTTSVSLPSVSTPTVPATTITTVTSAVPPPPAPVPSTSTSTSTPTAVTVTAPPPVPGSTPTSPASTPMPTIPSTTANATHESASPSRTRPSAGTGATPSASPKAPDSREGAGESVGRPSSAGSGFRASGASIVIASSKRGAHPAVSLGRFRGDRAPGIRRPAVRLRFVLSGSARITFAVFGPVPNCSLAGRFTVAGHAGLNSVSFRGRVQGRRLPAGLYTIVPQGAGRLSGPRVTVAIDGRGAHPAKQVPSSTCSASTGAVRASSLPGSPRHGGVEGAIAREAATAADTAATHDTRTDTSRKSRSSVSANLGKLWSNDSKSWADIAVLLTVLVSGALLLLAALRPRRAAMRFAFIRALDDHREHVAFLGYGFLVAAAILFVLTRLAM
jgi:hypothetical protein